MAVEKLMVMMVVMVVIHTGSIITKLKPEVK
jgi:hypothetical protein